MNFCSNCGAPATGTAYCGNCGQPMAARAAAPPGDDGRAQQPAAAASGVGPATARANPFADIPLIDYARDLVALVLLLVSFGMPWDLFDSATGKVYVILVTLLSVVSLALPYLKRGGVLPASWGTAELRLARLAANAPYIVVVLITVVLGYVGDNDGDGIGVGVAFGLAGALLAAQGRQAEQVPDDTGDGQLWRWVTLGVGALFTLVTVISLILFLVDDAEFLDWEVIAYGVLAMVFFLAVVAWPLYGVVRNDLAWRDVLILLGVVALFVGMWQLGADRTMPGEWSLAERGPLLVFIPGLAAAASAAGLRPRLRSVGGAAHWSAVSIRLFQIAMLAAVFGILLYTLGIVATEDGRGVAIVVLVLYLVLLLAGVVGRNALRRDPNFGRAVALICAGVFLLLGIVIASVLGASDVAFIDVVDATIISLLWWFAVAVIVALTAPKSVRQEYGPVAASQINLSSAGVRGASTTASAGATTGGGAAATPPTGATEQPAASTGKPSAFAERPAVSGEPAAGSAEQRAATTQEPAASTQQPAASAQEPVASTEQPAASAQAASTEQPVAESAREPEWSDEVPASPSVPETPPGDAGATAVLEPVQPAHDESAEQPAERSSGPADGPAAGTEQPAAQADSDNRLAGDEARSGDDEATRAIRAQPAGPVEQQVVTEAGFDSRTASDPNTPLQVLADIAAQAPSLRPYVAANPSTYPELLNWLSQLGDPAVDEALRRRS